MSRRREGGRDRAWLPQGTAGRVETRDSPAGVGPTLPCGLDACSAPAVTGSPKPRICASNRRASNSDPDRWPAQPAAGLASVRVGRRARDAGFFRECRGQGPQRDATPSSGWSGQEAGAAASRFLPLLAVLMVPPIYVLNNKAWHSSTIPGSQPRARTTTTADAAGGGTHSRVR